MKRHGVPMPPSTPLRFGGGVGREHIASTADFQEVGTLLYDFNGSAVGLTLGTATGGIDKIAFEYIGPDDLIGL